MPSTALSTLVTWGCGHFCIRHSTARATDQALIEASEADYWFLADTADEDLANNATDRHVKCSKNCPNCQESVSLSRARARANEAVRVLQFMLEGSKEMYLETGAKYYKLDFSQKAKYAHDTRCASAHDQFWISTTPRHLDSFFWPMDDMQQLCEVAGAILEHSQTHEHVKEAFVHINDARAEVGRLIAQLDDLLTGVELMFEVKSRHKENETRYEGLMSREAMVSIPNAMGWFARMKDWEDEAIDTTQKALSTRA